MKTCTSCGTEKSEDRFYRDLSYRDGRQASCKECRRDYTRAAKHGAVYPTFDACQTHKRCRTCRCIKPNDAFYAEDTGRNGRSSSCKTCKDAATNAWRERNKVYYNTLMREYRATLTFDERRDIDLKSWFGLPKGWYSKTLQEQGGRCASCEKSNPSAKRCFAVDHNHESGKVRGIICYGCNRLLRAFEHAVTRRNLIAYLKRYDIDMFRRLVQELGL